MARWAAAAITATTSAATDSLSVSAQQCPGRGLLTGNHRSTSNGQRLVAAKTIVEKSVFCVENVYISVKTEDLSNFAGGLSVEVLAVLFSCQATPTT